MSRGLFTDRFGLVSDVLAPQPRSGMLQGRHCRAAMATLSARPFRGWLKLLYPDPSPGVPGDDLKWVVRLALERRRGVKEQQKRIGSA